MWWRTWKDCGWGRVRYYDNNTHRECVVIDDNTHAVCIINIKKFLNTGRRLHFPLLSSSHSRRCNSNFFLPLCQFQLFIVFILVFILPFAAIKRSRCKHSCRCKVPCPPITTTIDKHSLLDNHPRQALPVA